MALARCFRYGAEIAKIVTTCNTAEDASRIEALYSIVLEDVDSLQGKLIAFGMGKEGKMSRLECLRRGAPFTYAALSEEDTVAAGQYAGRNQKSSIWLSRGILPERSQNAGIEEFCATRHHRGSTR